MHPFKRLVMTLKMNAIKNLLGKKFSSLRMHFEELFTLKYSGYGKTN